MIIEKINFRDQIRKLLIESIMANQLKMGQKLSLVEYAKKLNTSVTPVREAFTQLAQAGILEAIPNVGYCVKRITENEMEDIYSLIGLIESNNLLNHYSREIIQKLESIANEINSQDNLEARLNLDNQFHGGLMDKTKTISSELISNLKTRVFLVEMQFMDDRANNIESKYDHFEILSALKNNEIKNASVLILKHWQESYKYILNLKDKS